MLVSLFNCSMGIEEEVERDEKICQKSSEETCAESYDEMGVLPVQKDYRVYYPSW